MCAGLKHEDRLARRVCDSVQDVIEVDTSLLFVEVWITVDLETGELKQRLKVDYDNQNDFWSCKSEAYLPHVGTPK